MKPRKTDRNRVPIRRRIYEVLLADGPMNTGDITRKLDLPPTQTSSMLNMMSKPGSWWPVVRVERGKPGPGNNSSVWEARPRREVKYECHK